VLLTVTSGAHGPDAILPGANLVAELMAERRDTADEELASRP